MSQCVGRLSNYIGLYGLMSYLVSRRAREIGIRMALGADRSEVAWQVMREIGLLLLAGIVLGLPITLSGIRLVRDMLYGLSGTDPFSLTAAIGLLLFAAWRQGTCRRVGLHASTQSSPFVMNRCGRFCVAPALKKAV
jgi:ABC-type antimicrobial peptide transport system permease subunit